MEGLRRAAEGMEGGGAVDDDDAGWSAGMRRMMSESMKSSMSPSSGSEAMSGSLSDTSSTRGCDMVGGSLARFRDEVRLVVGGCASLDFEM